MIGRASQALELDSSGVLAVAVNVCEAGTVHPAVATATVQACLTACGARAQASAPMCPDEDGESKRYFSFGRFYSPRQGFGVNWQALRMAVSAS